jgi:hypothetical protein
MPDHNQTIPSHSLKRTDRFTRKSSHPCGFTAPVGGRAVSQLSVCMCLISGGLYNCFPVHAVVFLQITCLCFMVFMADESVRTSWPSSRPLRGRIRGLLVRTHKGTCIKWPQSAKKTRGARRPIEKKKKKKKSKAMTEARRNERAKCAAKVKERSGTRRHQARTTAADGGRQQ